MTLIEIVNQAIPWLLLVVTLWINYLFGDVYHRVWLFAGIKQLLWIAYITYTKDWHLLPTCLGLLVVYYYNHKRWNPEPGVIAKLVFVRKTESETEVVVAPPAPPASK